MSETTQKDGRKRLGLSRPGKLVLNKTVEGGQVRQSFSRGRSKAVMVEVRKKRTYVQDAEGRMKKLREGAIQEDAIPGDELDFDEVADDEARAHKIPHLTTEEKAARARALQDARRAEEEARVQEEAERLVREAEAAAAAAQAEAERAEREAKEAAEQASQAEEEPAQDEAEQVQAQGEEAQPAEEPARPPAKAPEPESPRKAAVAAEPEADEKPQRGKRAGRADAKRPASAPRRGERRRRSGRLTIAEALDDGGEERVRSLASLRRAREREKQRQRQQLRSDPQKVIRDVVIPESITVQELANRMAVRGADVVKALMKAGVMATITQTVDGDTAELVVTEFGHNIKRVSEADVELGLKGEEDVPENLEPRAPVVTVMGHVDHGKTSLLDAIRESDVVSGEAGGITQHIGAYQVRTSSGGRITFIDTPGHAAFTEMRARGAQVTDIVVLVVAADDGVMPQTAEAINHAKAAGVPIIVAINKIDLPGADPNRVRTELLQHDLVVEEMGGEVLSVGVSAKNRTNLDQLEEAILLQAELLDLGANPHRPGEGVVVEAKVEIGRGSVATVLVQRGTVRVGDVFVAGSEWGRVRALIDSYGNNVEEAGPSIPVEILGLNATPAAGDDVTVVENEARAREISEFRQRRERRAKTAGTARLSLDQMFLQAQEGGVKELPVVIKADVHGSVEAIVAALERMSTDEVKVSILHSGVGGINQSDVTLAGASDAVILGFNVRANPQARELARREKLDMRYYSIIYELTDDIRKALSGLLAPTLKENLLGYAEIREVFNITKVGRVAGCMVTEGVVRRGAKVRLLRDDVVIHEGSLSQLKRFKDDVREVKEGYDCGMAFANYQDIQQGDFIECFEMEEVAREL